MGWKGGQRKVKEKASYLILIPHGADYFITRIDDSDDGGQEDQDQEGHTVGGGGRPVQDAELHIVQEDNLQLFCSSISIECASRFCPEMALVWDICSISGAALSHRQYANTCSGVDRSHSFPFCTSRRTGCTDWGKEQKPRDLLTSRREHCAF